MGETSTSVETILKSINDINSDSFETDGDRANALLAAYALWQEMGNMTESCHKLAGMVNCDASFLGRILRHLAANNILEEVSTNMYKPTKLTDSLLQSKYGEWINWLLDNSLPSKTGYKSPTDPENGPFQYTKEYKGDLFKYFADNPREGECFNHCMGAVMAMQTSWLKIIPMDDLLSEVDPELPLVVDIGGDLGHDLDKFRVAYPDTASRLYLQDLPEVIERSTCPAPVNKMAHGFFQPQPVKHAWIYYIHAVLHDWPDEHARKILEMLRGALKPGYSHLLIQDYVVPDQGAHPQMTSYDLNLMTMVSGKEGTESEFRDLLHSAGYRLVRVWRSSPASQAIVQAELV
ncbi:hypothetical protein N7488_007146 [Penicillium malachiteum]|nr:hypothetical protein N7488_007146 [Penicillium malachiteum]